MPPDRWRIPDEGQVVPVRIFPLDQVELPVAKIPLDRFLALNGRCDAFVRLEPDEAFEVVILRKAGDCACLMFADAPVQIAGYADIQSASYAIRHDVDGDQPSFHERSVVRRGPSGQARG